MRNVFFVAVVMLLNAGIVAAEPLVLEQAGNVLQPRTLEIGLSDISYQVLDVKLTNTAGNVADTKTDTTFIVPFYARYAFTPRVEATLSVPYSYVSDQDTPAGASSVTAYDSGLADPALFGKYSFALKGWDLSAGVGFQFASGKQSNTLPSTFRQGFNFKPLIAARKIYRGTTFNANVSYNATSEYTDENGVKQQQGSVLSAGVGAEHARFGINWIGELIYNSLSQASSAGVSVANSAGSQTDLVLGARYGKGSIKTKFGVDISLGDETYRAYDYKIIAGITYLWKM